MGDHVVRFGLAHGCGSSCGLDRYPSSLSHGSGGGGARVSCLLQETVRPGPALASVPSRPVPTRPRSFVRSFVSRRLVSCTPGISSPAIKPNREESSRVGGRRTAGSCWWCCQLRTAAASCACSPAAIQPANGSRKERFPFVPSEPGAGAGGGGVLLLVVVVGCVCRPREFLQNFVGDCGCTID
jgi:hypothetical protein